MDYKIVRSKRKTLAIYITKDCNVEIRAPLFMSTKKIEEFYLSKINWIEKHKKLMSYRAFSNMQKDISKEEELRLKKEANEVLIKKTLYFSEIMDLYPNKVTITSAKTRFGSCSGKNNICYSFRLMLYPEIAQNYVVVHELAHIKYKNHSKDFYAEISKYLPDYKKSEKILLNY